MMTEAEWFAATDAEQLLACDEVDRSPRKLHLLMVGLCRLAWDRHGIPEVRHLFATAEQHAEGTTDPEPVASLRRNYEGLWFRGIPVSSLLASVATIRLALLAFLMEVESSTVKEWKLITQATRVATLRDVLDNPFSPVEPDPEWFTSTAVGLARGMYESRDFSGMPILADALQEAGCENADVLSHCRDPHAVHVCGCWVVDLVLGKD